MPRSEVKLTSRFPQISRELRPRVAAATKLGAEAIAQEAKNRVPVRNGTLRDAIHVEFKGDADWAVVAGNSKAFYGHMVEHGTTRAPAHPFLIPAFEARRVAVQAAIRTALQRL